MQAALLVIVLALAVGAYLVMRKPAKPTRSRPNKKAADKVPASRYSSLSIMLPKSCCSAAQDLSGQRFLTHEVPKLPLATCTMTPCKCGYMRHEDRREDEGDRRAIYGLRAELHALHTGEERRKRKGRRSGDLALA